MNEGTFSRHARPRPGRLYHSNLRRGIRRMHRLRIRLLLGALLTAAAAAATPVNAGSDEMPVKVDFIFRFNIRVGPSVMVPPDLAPWYMWFPYDPNMITAPAQSTPYPHWP